MKGNKFEIYLILIEVKTKLKRIIFKVLLISVKFLAFYVIAFF